MNPCIAHTFVITLRPLSICSFVGILVISSLLISPNTAFISSSDARVCSIDPSNFFTATCPTQYSIFCQSANLCSQKLSALNNGNKSLPFSDTKDFKASVTA